MKKIIIATLVGGIILFVWNALSWMVMPTHLHTFQHSNSQDAILASLKSSGLATGAYMMPSVDNTNVGAFDSDYHKKSKENAEANVGKPMATIFYNESMPGMDIGQILRGLLYSLIAVFCVCLLLSLAYQSNASFLMRWWMVMLIAIVYTMMGPLMMHNWMMEPWQYTQGFICDAFIGWGLTGLWLAKYMAKE